MSELREERSGASSVSLAFALPPAEAARIEAEVAAAMQAMVKGGDTPGATMEAPHELALRLLRERGELTAADMEAISGFSYHKASFNAAMKDLHKRGLVEIDTVHQTHIYWLRRQA